jgi:virginiamycin B lyase
VVLREYALQRTRGTFAHLLVAQDGSLWFADGSSGTICRLDTVTGTVSEVRVSGGAKPTLTGLIQAPDGGFWFGTGTWIGRIDPATKAVKRFQSNGFGYPGWGPMVIRNNAIWFPVPAGFGTFELSVHDLDYHQEFQTYRRLPQMLLAPDGWFWFALGDQGLGRVDSRDASARTLHGPSSERITWIALDAHGDLWYLDIGTHLIGRLSPTDEQRTTFAIDRDALPTSLTVDADGIVWYLDRDRARLGRLDPKTGAIRELELPAEAAKHLSIVVAIPHARLFLYGFRWSEELVLDEATEHLDTLAVPADSYVTGVRVDTARATVWIGVYPNRIIEM